MALQEVTFKKNDEKIVICREDQNRFDAVLYANLFVPSYVHGYSIAIEYMRNWFLSKLPENYFKYVHINGKHMFDDYKRWNKQNVKREKPYLAITPAVDYDYDREKLDLYNMGPEVYIRRSKVNKSFFRDTNNKLFVGMQMQELKMNFNFRIKVSTRAQQLDLFKKMELIYRIGGSQSEFFSADFHIPQDLLLVIANKVGFDIEDGNIKEPTKFLSYLNRYSDLPFTYKLRTVNGKYEFFIRLSEVYVNIWTLNKLSVDDGEREGHLDNNFGIDMEAVLRMPVPHFFVLYNERPLKYYLNVEDIKRANVNSYEIPYYLIPEENNVGWQQVINTSYLLDLEERKIDLTPLFSGTDIKRVIDDCLSNFISPKCFMDITIYRLNEKTNKYDVLESKMDYQTMEISFEDDTLIDEYIYIAVYMDKEYKNNTINNLENVDKNRVNSNQSPNYTTHTITDNKK